MSEVINHASRHKADLVAAIEAANVDTLTAIDADLEREGWASNGQLRQRIAVRKAALTGTA